jgi:hypothetical protein
MVIGNGVKNIQAAAYNGARTVLMQISVRYSKSHLIWMCTPRFQSY